MGTKSPAKGRKQGLPCLMRQPPRRKVKSRRSANSSNANDKVGAMKFVVRYCSSLLPRAAGDDGEHPRWLDYSVHPASKLGLHNALLAVYDRLEILEAHGGQFECAVFVEEGGSSEKLSGEMANNLFAALPRGEVKWLDIKQFLLPAEPGTLPTTAEPEASPAAVQLPLFEHTHTPYDDLDARPHLLDINI